MKYDFCGYATKNNIKCSDGRVIRRNAFKECDGKTVPLVWQHMHDDVENVLGHAVLENRNDGVYAYCSLNNTRAGQHARALIEHGDITSMSIYANRLVQNGSDVMHGVIREVSLVLAAANPGATIENLAFQHSDGSITDSEDEAIIYSGEELVHADEEDDDYDEDDEDEDEGEDDEDEDLEHADEETIGDVWNSLSDKQKEAIYFIFSQMAGDSAEHSEEGGSNVKKNVFDGSAMGGETSGTVLTHDQMSAIFADAQKCGSLKQAVLAHAKEYGISNIELLFPEARNINTPPEFVKRDTGWVSGFMSGVTHRPFSRIKSMFADITADEARAKGYVTGNKKYEEVFPVMTRSTTPTTIYKKQKFDRDDIVDITDFDVVSWVRREMRMMLEEEIARACLLSDGRAVSDRDKIDEGHIRPVVKDNDFYTMQLILPTITATGIDRVNKLIELVTVAMEDYEGSGNITMYARPSFVRDFRLATDKIGRYVYGGDDAVASALGVNRIIRMPILKQADAGQITIDSKKYLIEAVALDLRDYSIGADKGGQITNFNDFDIDYNQYKYLIETRISGCLTKHKCALVILSAAPADSSGGSSGSGGTGTETGR